MIWWDHVGKPGADNRYAREMEVYLGMCRRWRELPKPTIAMVQGACIAGGLMLAWVCDLIVAADDAFFADPVVRMGIPGVEYFAHPWVLGPRFAKEMLFTGDRFSAARAYELGMVSRVVPRVRAGGRHVRASPSKIATMPQFGLALAKRAVNQCEDQMGMRNGMDSVFGLHHVAHAHNAETGADSLAGHGRPVDEEGLRVNLDFDPPVAAFRAEVAAWLAANLPGQPAAVGGHGRGVRAGTGSGRRGWPRRAARGGVVASRVRRPGCLAAGVAGLRGGVPRSGRAGAGRPERPVRPRADPARARHRRAEGADPAADGARATEVWAQAWSEPDAGSDLAALRSRARRTDGGWLLSGQKTWSSRAVFADRAFGLFRSDPEAEDGTAA